MRIREKNLRFWGFFGFKLARLEFIWGSELPEAIETFEQSKKELLYMLNNVMNPDETDYESFTESILIYFMREDIEIHDCIMIGICIQRYQLSLLIDDDKNKKALLELAKSSLPTLNSKLVPDKDLLFSAICISGNSPLDVVFSKIMESLSLMYPVEDTITDNSKQNAYLFISYSSKDADIAHDIAIKLKENNINYWMAPESIPIGHEYTEMIVDAITDSCGIVLILSENSQSSIWVPKELDIALSHAKPIFPIHIDNSKLNKQMSFRLSNHQIIESYDRIESILPEIIKTLKDIVGTN